MSGVNAYAQVTAIARGLGAGTCWRSGRSPPGVTGRDSLQFAFYGRVSTEGHQDPVTSLAWQREQAATQDATAVTTDQHR